MLVALGDILQQEVYIISWHNITGEKKMCSDVYHWCQGCLTCVVLHTEVGRKVKAPLSPIAVNGVPEGVGVDILEMPLKTST